MVERRGAAIEARDVDQPLPRTVERRQAAPAAIEDTPVRETYSHRVPAEPAFRTEQSEHHGIQGPSFLGLSDDPDQEGDYLLEDESSSRGGLRKLVLVAILAAIIGLIFVQWRSSLRANPKHQNPATSSPSNAPSPQSGVQSPSANDDHPDKAEPAAMAQEPALPVGAANKSEQTNPEATPAPRANDPPAGASLDVAERSTAPPRPEAITTPDIPSDQKPSSTLQRAQQFLQGKGVQQNCEQGLIYLRAAAQKNEPAAAVQMGALYAAGHCVQQDKVMAYRWFNAAHELQPANQWIQRNLNQLWSEMSDQEHRLAAY